MTERLDVAIVTCVELPEPDHDSGILERALAARGKTARELSWNDPEADFARARVTVIRSTWDYPRTPDAFRAWVKRTAKVTRLWNTEKTVLWNLHKGYLLDLERAGIPVVPTRLVPRGERALLRNLTAGWREARGWVIKPAVGAGSRGALRVSPETLDVAQLHLETLLGEGDVLVQPYLESVEGYGERSIIWLGGEMSHAVRKSPRFFDGNESVTRVPIAADEAEFSRRVVALAPDPLLYARVDMARDAQGRPCVMELEVIEPSLFLREEPGSADRLAAAIVERLEAP